MAVAAIALAGGMNRMGVLRRLGVLDAKGMGRMILSLARPMIRRCGRSRQVHGERAGLTGGRLSYGPDACLKQSVGQ